MWIEFELNTKDDPLKGCMNTDNITRITLNSSGVFTVFFYNDTTYQWHGDSAKVIYNAFLNIIRGYNSIIEGIGFVRKLS